MAEIAWQKPSLISNAIVDNGDGTFDVTFRQSYHVFKALKPSIAVSSNGHRYYLDLADTDLETGARESWPLILENAWALLHNADLIQRYESIGHGGRAGEVFELFTNTPSQWIGSNELDLSKLDQLFNQQKALVTLATYSNGEQKYPDDYERATDNRIVATHTYYMTEVNVTKGTFTIRNP